MVSLPHSSSNPTDISIIYLSLICTKWRKRVPFILNSQFRNFVLLFHTFLTIRPRKLAPKKRICLLLPCWYRVRKFSHWFYAKARWGEKKGGKRKKQRLSKPYIGSAIKRERERERGDCYWWKQLKYLEQLFAPNFLHFLCVTESSFVHSTFSKRKKEKRTKESKPTAFESKLNCALDDSC